MRAVLLVSVLLAIGGWTAPGDVSAADDPATQAGAARAAGRLEDAVTLYERALQSRPDWVEGRWELAKVLYRTNRFRKARAEASRVVQSKPQWGSALALRGMCEARLANEGQALTDLLKARDLGIEDPGLARAATLQTALLLNRTGNPDAALGILRDFASEGRDTPEVIAAFGLSLLRFKYLPEEIPAEKREMVVLAGRAGYEMARSRRTSVGRMAIEELVSRYPNEPNVHYAYGLYLRSDDPEGAVAEFRRELGVSPDHYPAMVHIVLAELQAGQAERVLPLAERAVTVAPRAPVTRAALGRTLLALGQTERAIQELEDAVALLPDNPRLHFTLAQAFRKAGRSAEAEQEQKEFLRLKEGATPDADVDGALTMPDDNARTSTEAP